MSTKTWVKVYTDHMPRMAEFSKLPAGPGRYEITCDDGYEIFHVDVFRRGTKLKLAHPNLNREINVTGLNNWKWKKHLVQVDEMKMRLVCQGCKWDTVINWPYSMDAGAKLRCSKCDANVRVMLP